MADRGRCSILRFLGDLLNCPTNPTVYTMTLRVGPVRDRTGINSNQKGSLMADQITTQQEFDVSISNIQDASGKPAKLDGEPEWESSDPSIVDIRVADDGMSAVVGSLDAEGTATITVTADGRQGEEVVALTGVLTVVVAPADAVVFDLEAGEVRDRT